MPILTTHILSGIIILAPIFLLYRKNFPSPYLFLIFIVFFALPDIDHLFYWQSSMNNEIYPLSFQSLFAGMFQPRQPNLLHDWIFPATIAATSGIFYACKSTYWKYLAILALGWSVHLALDGVLLF